jgi:cobalt-zinc-cadmium efflux system outer membrane protein
LRSFTYRLFFLFSFVLYAADPITLEQALALAAENHPQLRAGEAQIDAARAGIRSASAYPNPQVEFLIGRQTFRVPGNVAGLVTTYSIAQPLDIGPFRRTRIEYAVKGRESTEVLQTGLRLAVLTGVRRTFFEALRRAEQVKILEDNLRLVEDFRRRTEVRVNVGEAGRLELIRADAELVTARSAVNSTRLQYVSAVSQLRAAIGTKLDTEPVPNGTLDPPTVLPPMPDVRQEILERHPVLQYARAEIRRADAKVAVERAMVRPQPTLRTDLDITPDVPIYKAGVAIPLPLWNKREGPIAEAIAELRQVQSLANARQLELLAAAESAYGRYEVATQNVAAFEQGLLREAQESVAAAETAYRLGERSILEVLDAQRVLRTVRLDFLNAQFDRQLALIDLDELRAILPGRK